MTIFPIVFLVVVLITYLTSPKRIIDLVYLASYIWIIGIVFFVFPDSFNDYPGVMATLLPVQAFWYGYIRRNKK